MMSRLLELPVKTVIPYVNSIIPDILFFFVLCFLLLSVFETFYCFFCCNRKVQKRSRKNFSSCCLSPHSCYKALEPTFSSKQFFRQRLRVLIYSMMASTLIGSSLREVCKLICKQ